MIRVRKLFISVLTLVISRMKSKFSHLFFNFTRFAEVAHLVERQLPKL